jgi:hypothetical protein
LERQASNLEKICLPYAREYVGNKIYLESVLKQFGPGYEYIEAQALHAMVRYYKPTRIIGVGSGVYIYCMVAATKINVADNGQEECKITCIEPFPSAMLKDFEQINLIPHKVQAVPPETFY